MIRLTIAIVLAVLGSSADAGEKTASRALAVQTLHDFHRCLEEKDFKKALTFLKLPKEAAGKEDKVIESLGKVGSPKSRKRESGSSARRATGICSQKCNPREKQSE